MQIRYFDDGLSHMRVAADYVAVEGDVLFPDTAGPDELEEKFPGYGAALATHQKRRDITSRLRALSELLPDATELTWLVLGDEVVARLPQADQDRLNEKRSLRAELVEL